MPRRFANARPRPEPISTSGIRREVRSFAASTTRAPAPASLTPDKERPGLHTRVAQPAPLHTQEPSNGASHRTR